MLTDIYNNKKLLVVLIFVIFLALRIPGLHLPYYQDERVWNEPRSLDLSELRGIPHPPLTGMAIILAPNLLGRENMRYMPFIFSMINFWLLFFLVKNRYSWNAALWSILFLSAGFYSVLASLMVDTDGQILPFFFLLSAIAYYNWQGSLDLYKKIGWFTALLLSLIAGFLVKFSFAVAIGAFIIDFIYSKREYLSRKILVRYGLIFAGSGLALVILILNLHHLSSSFNLSYSLDHWEPFLKIQGRNYFQTAIQFLKALLYMSPFLLAFVLLMARDLARKLSLFIIFIICGLIFYLVLFDFSSGALDRYFQFMIAPFSIISGVVAAEIFSRKGSYDRSMSLAYGLLFAGIIFLIQFFDHFVPALYPKEEWFNRVLSFKWNFLFPLTGGSGPMGFYVSWLFIALAWVAVAVLSILALWKTSWRKETATIILILGFAYNGVFIEEYLFGKINGSSVDLLHGAMAFIENDENIKKVITYNNIGNFELSNMGKFERRLYIAPKFESGYVDIINNFDGHYLVIDVPKIHPSSPYSEYFAKCETIFAEKLKYINSKIYNCQGVAFMR